MKFAEPDCQHCKSRRNSLFHFCHLDELEAIDLNKTCSTYKKGQVIFQEGTTPFGLFCINSGKVKMHKYASDGKEQIARIAKPGDFLGYCSLISGSKYPVSATALEDCTICMVSKQKLKELMQENDKFNESMINLICKTVDEYVDKMADLAYKPVRGRMAEALLFLNEFYIDDTNVEGVISITREDLASFVGTVKETAIRILKEFKDENYIVTDKSDIKVLDRKGLVHVSELYD